jgi:dynein light chain roadblock-type|eukprot:Stramenopile-MAST_4_protein_5789
MASEIEETLKRIQSHRGVTGILIVNKDGKPIKTNMSAEDAKNHATLISQLTTKARSVVRTLDPQNDLTFLRLRSKKNEIMIAPDKDYMLFVIQNPNSSEN